MGKRNGNIVPAAGQNVSRVSYDSYYNQRAYKDPLRSFEKLEPVEEEPIQGEKPMRIVYDETVPMTKKEFVGFVQEEMPGLCGGLLLEPIYDLLLDRTIPGVRNAIRALYGICENYLSRNWPVD